MNTQEKHLCPRPQSPDPKWIAKNQALDVLSEALSAFSRAVHLQQNDHERLEQLLKKPVSEKVDQVVAALLMESLIKPPPGKQAPLGPCPLPPPIGGGKESADCLPLNIRLKNLQAPIMNWRPSHACWARWLRKIF